MSGHHAELSPSGSSRWMVCPGSISLCASLGLEGTTSRAAALGTAAHFLAEQCLTHDHAANEFLHETIHVEEWKDSAGGKIDHAGFRKFKPGKKYRGLDLEQAYGFKFTVDDTMVEGVQVYLDYVRRTIDGATLAGIDHDMQVEVWCDLSFLGIPGLDGGTSDAVLIFDRGEYGIEIIDYKNGRRAVEVVANSQLRHYGLGAMNYVEEKYGTEVPSVTMTIVQPNAYHLDGPIRSDVMERDDLLAWADLDLIPCAEAVHEEDPTFRPGESQCFYCPASGGNCKAELEYLQKGVQVEFAQYADPDIESLSIEQLAKILEHEEHVKRFFCNVRDLLLGLRKNGEDVPGWVLSESIKHRRLKPNAEDILFDYLDDDEIYRQQTQTLSALEKALKKQYGADKAEEVMNSITERPEGDLILVRENAKNRKGPVPNAADDFAEYL